MTEFRERGWKNIKIVIPIQTIFPSQIMLDSERVTKAQPDEILFLLAQLARSGGRGELNLAFQVVGYGGFSGRKGDTNPNKSAKVSDLGYR